MSISELLPWIILLAAGAVVWRLVAKPAALFVVRVRAGRPEVVAGKVTDAFRMVVADNFREFGVLNGEVRGVDRGRRIALWFSSGIPPALAQRLRNWWVISGWSAPPRGCTAGPKRLA